jgi:hypothetical protein
MGMDIDIVMDFEVDVDTEMDLNVDMDTDMNRDIPYYWTKVDFRG